MRPGTVTIEFYDMDERLTITLGGLSVSNVLHHVGDHDSEAQYDVPYTNPFAKLAGNNTRIEGV